MQWYTSDQKKTYFRSLSIKCTAAIFLLLTSLLLAACGGGSNTASTTAVASTDMTSTPPPTLSLQPHNLIPTPAIPPLLCGGWATQTTPPYGTQKIGVYGKFTKNVDGNPVGVDGATATATVLWADGTEEPQTVTTTSDGLAVFTVITANRFADVNKINLVTITFDKPGVGSCDVKDDHAVFFTIYTGGSPTATTK